MQPTQRFKKTLLAGAVLFGTGITLNASAASFPVTAGAVPDVSVEFVTGYETLSFGTNIIGTKTSQTCSMNGLTGIADNVLLWDADGGNDDDAQNNTTFGALAGGACIDSTGLATAGTPVVLEIDAADSSEVTVTVVNVTGPEGYTYTPTAQSCVIDFDQGTGADTCVSLAGNTVSGVGMSAAQTDGLSGAAAETADTFGYLNISGKTRMVLAGSITLTSIIAAETPVTGSVLVQVTYE
ncbi:MAG: hypothetical protein ACI9ES_000557 [Oceanospirillaceae bacterium]|jgi:hypothetical protein